jgi:hypothetical protein
MSPWDPCGPVGPSGPCGPCGPCGPGGPWGPIAPKVTVIIAFSAGAAPASTTSRYVAGAGTPGSCAVTEDCVCERIGRFTKLPLCVPKRTLGEEPKFCPLITMVGTAALMSTVAVVMTVCGAPEDGGGPPGPCARTAVANNTETNVNAIPLFIVMNSLRSSQPATLPTYGHDSATSKATSRSEDVP